jgi:intracellular multiplication protein IcmO
VANLGYKGSGLAKADETKWRLLKKDTRTVSKKIYDFFESPKRAALFILLLAVSSFFFYQISDLLLLFSMIIFHRGSTRKIMLPCRLPKRSQLLDYNDPKPGPGNKPNKARGIYFYGNDLTTQEEIWFSNEDMRTHTLMLGTTGCGKTEAMISIAYNALVQGSGFIYVDGKGDNTLFAKIFALARSLGREDDILLINFMTGARDIIGPQKTRLSNTLNPFSAGSSGMLAQLVVSLMPASSRTPDGEMWKGRAIAFIEALMKVLVYARDQGYILLDANIIREYFELGYLETIVVDKVLPRKGEEPVSLADAPPVVLEPLESYLKNLPGYDKTKKGNQVSQVLEQHGFITMQLIRVFTSLADTYGHILRTNLAEVDFKDVVLNRRILIVLLPALEKSPPELANLGKIIIASLKSMMASGLGESVEGAYKDLITRKPTNAPTPFLCILDEYGYYAVPGFAIVPAQARSLGFSVIFAGQDLAAFRRGSKEETETIWANTTIKMAMRLEENSSIKDISEMAGRTYVALDKQFVSQGEALVFHYRPKSAPAMELRARITQGDLRKQRVGEVHIIFKKNVVRARTFFLDPPEVKKLRLNHFLRIEKPPEKKLAELDNLIRHFERLVKENDLVCEKPEENADINFVAQVFEEDASPTLIEKGVAALMAIHDREARPAIEGEMEIGEGEEAPVLLEDRIHVFSKASLLELTKSFVGEESWENFSDALLHPKESRQYIEYTERLAGKSESYSIKIANELIKDMELATHYPPDILTKVEASEIMTSLESIIKSLQNMKKE